MRTEHLVKKAQRGSKDAFIKLIDYVELPLYRAAMAILHHQEDAEDAVQEAVMKAFSKLADLRQPQYFKTWITRILINCCYDILHRRKGLVPLQILTEDDLPGDDYDAYKLVELSIDVRRALEELSRNDQLALTLYYFNDLPVREIARILSVSEAAAKQRLYNGRKRFEHAYSRQEEDDDEN